MRFVRGNDVIGITIVGFGRLQIKCRICRPSDDKSSILQYNESSLHCKSPLRESTVPLPLLLSLQGFLHVQVASQENVTITCS